MQKSQAAVLHSVVSGGLGQSSQRVSFASDPSASVTHVHVRERVPPPQSAEQGPHSPACHRTEGAQRLVAHACSVTGGASST